MIVAFEYLGSRLSAVGVCWGLRKPLCHMHAGESGEKAGYKLWQLDKIGTKSRVKVNKLRQLLSTHSMVVLKLIIFVNIPLYISFT